MKNDVSRTLLAKYATKVSFSQEPVRNNYNQI